jgi:hypothetical protein
MYEKKYFINIISLYKAVSIQSVVSVYISITRQYEQIIYRMAPSGMLHRVALVRADVSEELSASIIRVTRICELGTLAVTSNRRTLQRNIKPHGVTSQKTVYFIVTAVKTSNQTLLGYEEWCLLGCYAVWLL